MEKKGNKLFPKIFGVMSPCYVGKFSKFSILQNPGLGFLAFSL